MDIGCLKIGITIGKGVIFTIRGCFQSVCHHPFLVGTMCLLICVSKSSPFVFSLLVSASPVLVCTAVLLGTFLSFGEPNTPQIETEEREIQESVSIKTGVPRNATVVDQHERYSDERGREKRRDEAEQPAERPSLSASKVGEERSRGSKLGNAENLESYDGKSEADSFDSEMVHVDFLDTPPHSDEDYEDEDEDEDDEDNVLDSGSDEPDIMLLFDEVHPLLDDEVPNEVQVSRDVSDVDSTKSLEYVTSSHGSHDETENHEALKKVVVSLDIDDNEDEGEDKDEETKAAFTWTEQDQKNLMDLGSSEMERNRRLESVILKRRARKHMSMIQEMNLIDLETSDPIAPVSTTRTNPFLVPHDSYGIPGLPPVPGSAPSNLLQRRLEMNSEPNL
ncbi:hypothetical protein Salat_0535600 [Sesamum alatum]|uniref:Uncharacterized protein n=1 Tax=Sesamum alatum TaxID=300844 RepID=A0AAE2CTN1_9LAMI|nr:hypothetical protein Salat_0535600 [Sesamum alatum]